uniref:Uncharacterized protein n=1 Tax=Caenorhabditis japonica TaxID=281687 RepID=A0A8R1HKK9_CAEJA
MDSSIATTSDTTEVQFDDDFIEKTRYMSVEELTQHLELLRQNYHPLLRSVEKQIRKNQEAQNDRIMRHRASAEKKVHKDFDSETVANKIELDCRLAELQEEAKKRSVELERSINHEFAMIDIGKPHAPPLEYETNKKTLRGRGGGQIIEVPTYFNANQCVKLPEVTYKYNFAFTDGRIREDIESVEKHITNRNRLTPSLVVSIQKPKLTVDSKSFKHGEDVIVTNQQFGEFHARVEILSDKHVLFKGVHGWDSRQLSASLGDLESGRLTISKFRGKEKDVGKN